MTKNKKLFALLTAFALVLTSVFGPSTISTSAEETDDAALITDESGAYTYTELADGTVSLVYFNGCATPSAVNESLLEINIPETIDGKTVSAVQAGLLTNNQTDGISYTGSIIFPASVTQIDPELFQDFEQLCQITVDPDNPVYTAKDNILYSKDETELIRSPRLWLGNDINNAVHSYTIPDSVVTIADRAFYYNSFLEEVTIPASVTSIGNEVFTNDTSLKNIFVADKNTAYKDVDGVLFTADGKTLVRFPIGQSSKEEDDELWGFPIATSISYTIPNGVETIAAAAFQNCVNGFAGLLSVTFPSSLKKIESYAFSDCTLLLTLALPEGVTDIGEYAFYNCGFDTVTIPKSVTSIGDKAFGYDFSYNSFTDAVKDDFSIICTEGTAGEKYAKDNEISYSLNQTPLGPTDSPTATPSTQPSETPSTTPSTQPSQAPSTKPSAQPSQAPTAKPVTSAPTKTPKVTKPAAVKLVSVKNKKGGKAVVIWKKNTKANGYELQYSTSKKFKNTKKVKIKKASVSKTTLKKLKKKKTYYIRIRTYNTNGKTTKYSTWSKAKKIKIKK